MQGGRRDGVFGKLPVWRRGQRRGQFEAVRTVNGQRERRTLGTSDPHEADRLISRLNREVVTGGRTTVKAVFDLYRQRKSEKGKWREDQDRSYRRIVPVMGSLDASELDPRTVEAFVEDRRAAGASPDTVRLEVAYLRAALRHAEYERLIPHAPRIKVPSPGKPRERWLTRDEVYRLIDAAQELHVKLFIVLSVATAGRPSHVLGLRWEQIDFDRRTIDLGRLETMHSNKRRALIPMNDTAEMHLRMAQPFSRAGYVIEYRGKPVAKIRRGIEEAAKRAGLEGVTPYVLRHTAGVWMAMAGVSIEEIADYMGHSRIETTRRHYAHHHPQFMTKSAKALEI